MENNNKKESKALMIDYDAKKLAHDTAAHLTPVLYEIVESIQEKKQNEYEKPISMAEACVYLGITRTTFSKIVGKGEVAKVKPVYQKPQSFGGGGFKKQITPRANFSQQLCRIGQRQRRGGSRPSNITRRERRIFN